MKCTAPEVRIISRTELSYLVSQKNISYVDAAASFFNIPAIPIGTRPRKAFDGFFSSARHFQRQLNARHAVARPIAQDMAAFHNQGAPAADWFRRDVRAEWRKMRVTQVMCNLIF